MCLVIWKKNVVSVDTKNQTRKIRSFSGFLINPINLKSIQGQRMNKLIIDNIESLSIILSFMMFSIPAYLALYRFFPTNLPVNIDFETKQKLFFMISTMGTYGFDDRIAWFLLNLFKTP